MLLEDLTPIFVLEQGVLIGLYCDATVSALMDRFLVLWPRGSKLPGCGIENPDGEGDTDAKIFMRTYLQGVT